MDVMAHVRDHLDVLIVRFVRLFPVLTLIRLVLWSLD